MIAVNPKAKCPKCGTFMTFVGKTRAWGNKYQCTRCGYKRFTKAVKPWQRVTEANLIEGNPLTAKEYDTLFNIVEKDLTGAKESIQYKASSLVGGKVGGNPMAKKKRTKKMKILGIPLIPLAIIGGLVYWLSKRT